MGSYEGVSACDGPVSSVASKSIDCGCDAVVAIGADMGGAGVVAASKGATARLRSEPRSGEGL